MPPIIQAPPPAAASTAESPTDPANKAPTKPPPAKSDKPTASRGQGAPAANPKGTTVQGVVVTAAPQAYRSSIDRRSYSIANDLQATSGSIGDVLRNVPSVEVDVQGNLSLRGDPSVTILVDGKPSALFSGPNRADALQQLPANQYERVEVMTNPSAAFKPDGTGGIINLITKKGAAAGRTGSVRANIGGTDRYNASVSGSYNATKLSLSGGAGFRRDSNGYDQTTDQQLVDPTTGQLTPTHTIGNVRQRSTSGNARASIDYDLDPKTRLSASVNAFTASVSAVASGTFRSAATTGVLAQDYDALSRPMGTFTGGGGSATYLRKFSGDEHELSVRLSYNTNASNFGYREQYTYLRPAGSTLFLDNRTYNDQSTAELKAEYKRPLPGAAKLVTGYELQVDDASFDRRGLLGDTEATATATPGLNNVFDITQAVHALYTTYERSFGPFTILPGLRLEEVVIDSDQRTSGIADHWSYFNAYPTLHLAYKLDATETLTASFSRRVQRPGLQSLNPFLVYNGPLSYSQGNARLQPSVTESFELGYEYRKKQSFYQATLFFRDNHDSAVSVTRDLGGGVLLTTQENLGSSRNGGLELVANNKFGKTLSYNASATVYYNQIDSSNLGFTAGRSDVSFRGRISLNWQPTKKDFAQLNLFANGRQLTPQGYREPSSFMTLGYRHTFTEKLSGVMTVTDPFDMAGGGSVIDTPQLKQHTSYAFHQRAIYFGFTYALGSPNRRRPESFDFGGGPDASPAR